MKTESIYKKATINANARDTFLEPWIGWTFDIINYSKNYIWVGMDYGYGSLFSRKAARECFDCE